MAVRLSTGLAASMLGSYGLRAMMNYGWIAVYDGTQPAAPDIPPSDTSSNLIARVTTGGDPFLVNDTGSGALVLEQQDTGVLAKGGTWILTGEANATAVWWRWFWNAFDDNQFSLFYPRMDGAVGESLVLADTSITTSTSVEIEAFNVQFRS